MGIFFYSKPYSIYLKGTVYASGIATQPPKGQHSRCETLGSLSSSNSNSLQHPPPWPCGGSRIDCVFGKMW